MKGRKTGGKKMISKKVKEKPSDKPMSHGDKHKALMDRISGDPEV